MLWSLWKHLCYLAIKYSKRCCKAYQSTYVLLSNKHSKSCCETAKHYSIVKQNKCVENIVRENIAWLTTMWSSGAWGGWSRSRTDAKPAAGWTPRRGPSWSWPPPSTGARKSAESTSSCPPPRTRHASGSRWVWPRLSTQTTSRHMCWAFPGCMLE